MIHRLFLALLGCLLGLTAPVSAHTTASRLPVVPTPVALFAVEFSDAQDCGPLTLHLDGLHHRAGPCGGVLVRQNPWSAFDPEGLFVSALITAGFAAYDTYQYATGKMSGAEYAGAMALNGAALLADVATAGAGGGLAVRAASVAIKVAKVVDKADTVYSTANGAIRTAEAIANGDGTGAVINGVLTAVGAKQMGGAGKAPDAPDVKTARTTADQSNTASDAHTTPPGGLCFVAGTVVVGGTGDRRSEDLRVGARVLTNDTGAQDSSTMIDPETWRLVQLHLPNPDGSRDELHFEVLRSPRWMEAVGAKPGAAIWFALAEMGVAGLATVDAVKPCPPIARGPGRVVLATMTHFNGFVRRLHFEGTTETLLPTATHRLYSEDRQAWVPAGELRAGETLRTQSGRARLAQIERVPGVHRVFNIEVETEHCYFVGPLRVLSHNENPCAAETTKEIKTRPTKGADGGTSEHIIERDASGEVISKTHRVTTDGKVVHQHQDHQGKHGGERRFPDKWVEYPEVNAPPHVPRPSKDNSITDKP